MVSRRSFIKSIGLISLFGALPAAAIPNDKINPPQIRTISIVLIKDGIIIGRANATDIIESRAICLDFLVASPILVSGELSGVLFNKSKIKKLFNNKIALNSQKDPFDIIIAEREDRRATEIKNVWLAPSWTDPIIQYETEDFIVIDNIKWQAEYIRIQIID